MKKKILFIALLALFLVLLSLFYEHKEGCIPQGPPGSTVMCRIDPGYRGFPFQIYFTSNLGSLELERTVMQTFGFALDFIFYFIVISIIYIGYSKFTKKGKKK